MELILILMILALIVVLIVVTQALQRDNRLFGRIHLVEWVFEWVFSVAVVAVAVAVSAVAVSAVAVAAMEEIVGLALAELVELVVLVALVELVEKGELSVAFAEEVKAQLLLSDFVLQLERLLFQLSEEWHYRNFRTLPLVF